jgi:tetratricopeptide (TPR) repeat protein
MAKDTETVPAGPEPEPLGRRLDSWKEIASYLNRHVTTVRRWEQQEGLPVHRHRHAKLGSIFAFARELDAWFEGRRRLEALVVEPDRPSDGLNVPGPLPVPPGLVSLPTRSSLVGRDAELTILADAWRLACDRRPQFVLIAGDAGIGKTRLALDFGRGLANRATVLVGRCEREALVPFAPFVSMLQWLVRATPAPTLQSRLAAIDGSSELAQLVPDLSRRIHLATESVSASFEGHRFRMFDAYSQLVTATAHEAPMLLIVEDVHWADHGSMLLLRHLVRSTRDAPLCLVATYRPTESQSLETREILDDLRREHARSLVLNGLGDGDVHRVIAGTVGREIPGWLLPLMVQVTEGNPLFVIEMVRHLDEAGWLARVEEPHPLVGSSDYAMPDTIRALFERRLDRLRQGTRALLTMAAVVGRQFQLSILEALGYLDEDAVLDAMDEALAGRIIEEEPGAPGNFAFTHALIRETLYSSMTAARRVRLHYRIATALERTTRTGELAFRELAYHFARGASYKGAAEAVEYASRAGDHGAASLAMEDAAQCYGMAVRALDFLPAAPGAHERRVDLHVKRGRCLSQVGQWAAARGAFEAAVSLLSPGDDARRCELLVNLAEAAFWLMDLAALRRYSSEAQDLADRIARDDLWGDARAWAASAMVSDGDVEGGVEADRQTLARVGGIRSFGLARVPLTLYWLGRHQEAVAHATEAVENARTGGEPAFLLYALQHLGLSLSGAGRYDEAIRAFDEARAFGRHCGALPLLARATSMSVAPLLSLGDLESAKARALEARELAQQVGFEPPLVSAGIDLLLIFARAQDPGRAEPLLAEISEAVRNAQGWHGWKWNMRLAQARAELALARGRWADAETAATQVVDQSRPRHRAKYEALGLASRARARQSLKSRVARDDAQSAVSVARRLGDPAVLLTCLRVLLAIEGRDAVNAEALRIAKEILAKVTDENLRRAFSSTVGSRWLAGSGAPPV